MRTYLYNLATDKYKGLFAAIIKFFLFVLSLIYCLAVGILILFYRYSSRRLDCKVISVGNITLGGTGKTSLVEFIARYLKQHGHKVAILTRGYKRKSTDYESRVASYENMGDEAYMLSRNLDGIPVLVDADRIRSAHLAIRDYGVDTVILDDGFQQWRIIKDLDIVTINATCPFGNRHMIPRGILREPIFSLGRADMFVLTKTNLDADIYGIKDTLSKLNPRAVIIESIHQPLGFYDINSLEKLYDREYLKGKTVTLFSGIGDPDSFENLVARLGINIGATFRFGDHHNYTKEDLDKIIKNSREKNIDIIVTTQKDAIRLFQLGVLLQQAQDGSSEYSKQGLIENLDLRILTLRIGLMITKDEQRFYNRLHKLYSL